MNFGTTALNQHVIRISEDEAGLRWTLYSWNYIALTIYAAQEISSRKGRNSGSELGRRGSPFMNWTRSSSSRALRPLISSHETCGTPKQAVPFSLYEIIDWTELLPFSLQSPPQWWVLLFDWGITSEKESLKVDFPRNWRIRLTVSRWTSAFAFNLSKFKMKSWFRGMYLSQFLMPNTTLFWWYFRRTDSGLQALYRSWINALSEFHHF